MIHLILLLSSLLTLFLLPLAGADLVKNGRVYACILLPEKGKSSIRPYLSLGKKMPFDKGKFTHNKRKYAPLTPVPRKAVYRFTFRLAPYERGYLYLRGNNVLVKNITLVSP